MSSSKKIIVVTGGAGYIGGCTCFLLERQGYTPVVLDNFVNSQRPPSDWPFACHEVDLSDWNAARKIWGQLGQVHAVLHFAALTLVPESVSRPEDYLRNNMLATLNTAQCALEHGTKLFIHSSSCAVYGIPQKLPIMEECPTIPSSPYGMSKLIGEQILGELCKYRGLRVLNLRYFNPAGSVFDATWGESHSPETHLVPSVVKAVMAGKPIPVYGTDYPTPDGTCVRDFIHVEDLAAAHIKGLELLDRDSSLSSSAINLGTGTGTSVREIIDTVQKVVKKAATPNLMPRRPGDPPVLVADNKMALKLLGWAPKRTIEEMVSSHYQWELKTR